MAQLVEQPLLIPEVRGSDPVIGKIYIDQLFTINCIEKKKINKKRPGMAHFFLKKKKISTKITSRQIWTNEDANLSTLFKALT